MPFLFVLMYTLA